MSRWYRYMALIFLVVAFTSFFPTMEAWAQCPMCRIGAETNLATGGSAGKGLNRGILFLLGLPYILVGTLGYIWWRNKKNNATEE